MMSNMPFYNKQAYKEILQHNRAKLIVSKLIWIAYI